MAAKRNHGNSPEKGRKKNPLYREHRLLPRKPGGTGKAAPPPSGKKDGQNAPPEETGGPGGPEPTRYGDWERKGRCVDF